MELTLSFGSVIALFGFLPGGCLADRVSRRELMLLGKSFAVAGSSRVPTSSIKKNWGDLPFEFVGQSPRFGPISPWGMPNV